MKRLAAAMLLGILVLICAGCRESTIPEESILSNMESTASEELFSGNCEALNEQLYDNISEYMKENPLTLTTPAYMDSAQWFWQLERNFMFQNITGGEKGYVMKTSAQGEDLDWLQETLLKGIENVTIEYAEDSFNGHEERQKEYMENPSYLTIREKAKKDNFTAFVNWNGFIHIQVQMPNDYIRIISNTGNTFYVDTPTEEHCRFLEQIFEGQEIEVRQAMGMKDARNNRIYENMQES